jgi:hypothetical protein
MSELEKISIIGVIFFMIYFLATLTIVEFCFWFFPLLCSRFICYNIYILWNVFDSLIKCFKIWGTFIASSLKNVKHSFGRWHYIYYWINGCSLINICIWPRYTPMYCLLWTWNANLMGHWWHWWHAILFDSHVHFWNIIAILVYWNIT